MQYELKSCCTTENMDFYVWKSFAERMQVPDGQNKFNVKDFLKPSISTSWLKHGLKILNPTTLNIEKIYAVIEFKIFNALSREKKWKNWKSSFLHWLNKAALNLRRWTQCSSHGERKLSNEELMQTHEEFGLATWDPEKDCCNKGALVSDWIKTFYSEAIIKFGSLNEV